MKQNFTHGRVAESVAAQKKILAALEARPEFGEVNVYPSVDRVGFVKGRVQHEIVGGPIVFFDMNIPFKGSAAEEFRPVRIKFGQYHITVQADKKILGDFNFSDPAAPQEAIDALMGWAEKAGLIQAPQESILPHSSGKKTAWRAAADMALNSAAGLVRKWNTPKLPGQTKKWLPSLKPRQ